MLQERPPVRSYPEPDLRLAVEPTARRVRVRFGDAVIADSRRALLLREYGGPDRMPTYFFPPADVRLDLLCRVPGERPGERTFWTVRVGDRVAERAAWALPDPPPDCAALLGHLTFSWNTPGLSWHEEDEEVFVHARDPHHRVDVLGSSRHVRVVIAGETVAESRRPHLLFETRLPPRLYLPREDVRLDLLRPSGLRTRCPYKGVASYWSVVVGEYVARHVVWSYLDPIPECPRVRGLLCFFDEWVDVFVDGEARARPRTPWSRGGVGRGERGPLRHLADAG